MKKIYFFTSIFFIVFSITAQDLNTAKLDSLFSIIEEHEKGMGSISIFKKGEEIYHNAFGYADIGNNIETSKNTKYRIGSITKTFTSVLIMQLVENEKLDLEEKLSKFFPEIPNASGITVENLLRHQSGLFNFTNSEEYQEWMETEKTREELLEIFKKNGTIFKSGEKTEYSNTNFVLLSFIAEDITGKSYPDLLQENIIKPLGLENTYYGGKINSKQNEALSYKKRAGWYLDTETHMSIPLGAGGMVSTPYDLNTFFTALFNGELVNENSLNKMKAVTDGAGIGLFPIPFNEYTFYGHSGGIDSFSSIASYLPEENMAIAFSSNGMNMSSNDIIIGVLSTYFRLEYELPVFTPEYEVSAEELLLLTGVYGSETFPLKITITAEENVLIGQGTGQPSFRLEAVGKNKFKFDPAQLSLEFIPEEDKMILNQGGRKVELKRE